MDELNKRQMLTAPLYGKMAFAADSWKPLFTWTIEKMLICDGSSEMFLLCIFYLQPVFNAAPITSIAPKNPHKFFITAA